MLRWRREKKWTANLQPTSIQESKKIVKQINRLFINSGGLNHCTSRLKDGLYILAVSNELYDALCTIVCARAPAGAPAQLPSCIGLRATTVRAQLASRDRGHAHAGPKSKKGAITRIIVQWHDDVRSSTLSVSNAANQTPTRLQLLVLQTYKFLDAFINEQFLNIHSVQEKNIILDKI